MSGFIGIISPPLQTTETELLDAPTAAIASCCDDYLGSWKSQQADLRFGWLKTFDDTADEHLPFTLDENLRIIGDVRLDNRLALIAKLGQRFNAVSPTTPDSYLILYAYQHWGEDCLQQISGDYAFAIWNERESYLFCARDHFGVIPLYYTQLDNRFLFTNFYRALKEVPNLTLELNDDVLRNYWTQGVNRSFDQTIYNTVKKLPPAHRLIYNNGKIDIRRYWEMPTDIKPIRYKNTAEYVNHFFRLFEKSIKDRTRTNKVACQLSGGMDSSAITATTKRVLDDAYGRDNTVISFNIIYQHFVNEKEGFFGKLTAHHLNIPIKQYIAENFLKNISQPLTSWIPEPVGIPNATAESQILYDAEKFSRVLLSGFGGDPLFGYDPLSRRKLAAKGKFLQVYRDDLTFYRTFGRFSGTSFRQKAIKLIKKNTVVNRTLPPWYNRAFFSENNTLPKLTKDGTSMRSSYAMSLNPYWSWLFESSHPGFSGHKIKVRHPFFSMDLILFMAGIPPHLLYRKSLLRMSMIPFLPEEVIHRPKTVLFGDPHSQNLKTKEVLDVLKKQLLESEGFLSDKIDIHKLLTAVNDSNCSSAFLKDILTTLTILSWRNYKI